jgi:hypothetical protein
MADEELYDLQADPDEINNLAQNPEYQEVLHRLRGALDQWITGSNDQGRFPEAAAPAAANKSEPKNPAAQQPPGADLK